MVSHANCDHPGTTAARTICRRNQEKLTGGNVSKRKIVKAPALQVALTSSYRDTLLGVAGTTVAAIRERLNLSEADLADIDLWFEREYPDLVKLVKRNHKKAGLLTANYLRQHAALAGFQVGVDPAAIVEAQLAKSLAVTGPGAFKKHIAGGGSEAEALEVMQTTLPGSAERLSLEGSRKTLENAVEDLESPVLGYTRRTSGSACEYCRGLSQDPVYAGSNEVKTFHAHDHCTCTGEPFYLDDDRKAVNRIADAEAFAAEFQRLEKFGVPVGKMAQIAYDADVDIHGYVRDGYTVNAVMRGTSKAKKTRTDVDILELIDEMTYKFGPAPEDFAVWRGMLDGDKVFGAERWAENLEGLKWTDEAFTSTTMQESFATSWLSFLADPKIKMKDTNRVKMNLLVREGGRVLHITGNNQFEILLDKGAKFRVVKDHGFDEDLLARVIDVEVTF